MAKVKLTKNELKNQKDMLKRFQRYLPTLILKKQQLQMVMRQVEAKVREQKRAQAEARDAMDAWIAVFGEDIDVAQYIKIQSLRTSTGNIAGIDIPVFEELRFEPSDHDLYATPPWVDAGIEALCRLLSFDAEIAVLEEQLRLLENELRITTQRVNLFEKIKIPEAKENIRQIRIYLGDQQTAAVVRGKIAKNKVEQVS
ncbi:V-type ATP synthase subunit D [Spirochaeta africana]|uniref:H(+)-transporting ATP synthase, vacuolar type, subunit D n=1 Tax=Spirochaeta africana (strain ATCC 700263 / DSM 8902 / Z-7692) TaxID=889378 RepID=H9UJK8_SPIAZ|nr:V-type ATP synthase subunit D [Spirochaeta africana]AFG37701.1 H(+)-transporting ATP synthase, vacuolar type, subunit D [Spirochaeta africana DSM 8902]